jgi:hypothetical protein
MQTGGAAGGVIRLRQDINGEFIFHGGLIRVQGLGRHCTISAQYFFYRNALMLALPAFNQISPFSGNENRITKHTCTRIDTP